VRFETALSPCRNGSVRSGASGSRTGSRQTIPCLCSPGYGTEFRARRLQGFRVCLGARPRARVPSTRYIEHRPASSEPRALMATTPKRLRVLLLVDQLSGLGGGAEVFLVGLATHLPRERFEVSVCATRVVAPGPLAEILDAGAVPYIGGCHCFTRFLTYASDCDSLAWPKKKAPLGAFFLIDTVRSDKASPDLWKYQVLDAKVPL